MKILDIGYRFIADNTPEQNAYIEAFHKALKKREQVWPYEFKSFQEADNGITSAFIDYNQNRPHSSLGSRVRMNLC
jgi:transposase InsO family protein